MRPSVFRAISLAAAVGGMLLPPTTGRVFAAGEAIEAGSYTLYLEVLVNGVSTGLVIPFLHDPDGSLAVAPDEMEETGVLTDPSAIRADGLIDVARLPGLTYHYDQAAQTIDLRAADQALQPHVIGANASAVTDADPAMFGALVNYRLSLGVDHDGGGLSESFSAWLEPRLFGQFGNLSTGLVIRLSPSQSPSFVRLGTTWTYSNVDRLITYHAGDIVSGGLSWTRPIRIGGVQVERNFGLRPDLVTYPVPQLSGSAAVPSAIDIYINNMQRLSDTVPAGPFEIAALPVVTGAGEARIVLRDETGRETVTELPFFASPDLLRSGLTDFSLEAGFPRIGFGTTASHYVATPVAVATVRYGAANWLTLQGHVEAGSGTINGGLGGVFALGHYGVTSVALSGGGSSDGFGFQLAGTLDLTLGDIHFAGAVAHSFGSYRDLATTIAENACPVSATTCDGGPARFEAQAALWLPLFSDALSISLGYTHVDTLGDDHSRIANISLRGSFGGPSFYATAYADFAEPGNYGVYAGVSASLGHGIHAAVSARTDENGANVTTTLNQGTDEGIDGLSWRLRGTVGADPSQLASVNYQAPFAQFDARIEHTDTALRGTIGIDGAVVVAGGGVFFSTPVHDAFAIVDAGVPGVDVRYENRLVGTTNANGQLLVPNLRAYESNRIDIDPTNLPIDATVAATTMTVVPGDGAGVMARFDIEDAPMAATVVLRGPGGAFVAVGSHGVLNDAAAQFVVGYDGIAYLTDLSPTNRIVVTQPDGTQCSAAFDYAPQPGAQVTVPLTCRPI